MAGETLSKDQDTRLVIVAEIRMLHGVNMRAAELFADRLRDFILGPRMPGWCDNKCFTVKIIEEPADARNI